MKGEAKSYSKLRDYLETVPIIDSHDHSSKTDRLVYQDPIQVLVNGRTYFSSDLYSASSEQEMCIISDTSLSLDERWPVLEKVWKRTCHTGYAQMVRRVLKYSYGLEDLSLAGLKSMEGRLIDQADEARTEKVLDDAKIVVRLVDCEPWPSNNLTAKQVLDGSFELCSRARLVTRLTAYHNLSDAESIRANMEPLNRHVTSLSEYLEGCRAIFEGYKKFGAVAFKDQSAYMRSLEYGNPTRAEAESVFNWLVEDPFRKVSRPDGAKPLGDFIFHEFMRMARDMDLPVQIHTGHLGGGGKDVRNANAAGLTKLIELHRDVRFDLFHANWPYDGEILFLAKSHSNVALNFCWANIIDPIYCQRMFKQALSSVPHSKIHGYGSDFGGLPADHAWAHAGIARDNIAIALSDLVEMEYLGLEDAKEVGRCWLFDNANEYFRLGLPLSPFDNAKG